jgi:hypothetical protein
LLPGEIVCLLIACNDTGEPTDNLGAYAASDFPRWDFGDYRTYEKDLYDTPFAIDGDLD